MKAMRAHAAVLREVDGEVAGDAGAAAVADEHHLVAGVVGGVGKVAERDERPVQRHGLAAFSAFGPACHTVQRIEIDADPIFHARLRQTISASQ